MVYGPPVACELHSGGPQHVGGFVIEDGTYIALDIHIHF